MEFQDWKEIKWDKTNVRKENESKKDFLKRQTAHGRSSIIKKHSGNGMTKLETKFNKADDEGKLKHKSVPRNVSKRISQKRQEKNMSQSDLAKKLNVQVNIIKEYEKHNSKIIPSANILNKIEKILGRVRE